VNMPTPGQNAKLTFTGAANKRVSLKGSNSTVSGRTVSIQDPNGGLVVSVPSGTMNWFIDTQTLQGPGTYAVLVDPSGDNTGSTTLTLYEVPSDVSGPITTDGTPVTANMLVPGQNARLTFDSTGNRRISLKGSANSVTLEDVTIYNPSDATVVTFPFTSNEWFLDTMTLQDPGTYKIALDPSGSSIGSTTLRLYDVVDVTGPITPSGSSVTADMMTPGQNAEYTFSGVVDQRISLKVTGNTVPSQVAAIIDPDEIVLTNPTVTAATWFIDTMTLQKEGTYKVLLNPSGTNTGSTTLNLYDVPPDFMTSMEINGLAHIVPLTTPGRNGLVTFNGSYGQQATVQIPGSSIGLVTVTLLRPDGMTVMTTTTSASSSFNLATQQLPQTGTYTVTIDPVGANSGTMTIKVSVPPVDPPEE